MHPKGTCSASLHCVGIAPYGSFIEGAAVCMLLWTSGQSIAMLTSCALTVVLRVCAAAFRWSLPKARP